MTINFIFTRIVKTWSIGIITYWIIKKLFPEKKMVEPIFLDPPDVPVSDTVQPIPKGGNFQKIAKRLIQDRAFKFAMLAATTYFGYDMFQEEILALLSSKDLIKECSKAKSIVKLEICEIVEKLDLVGLQENIKELVIKENLTTDQKTTLLKIKLDAVINSEYPNKKVALIAILTAIMASLILVGPYGLMIFLGAIYQLWKEGKISTAVYKQMKDEALKQLI
jgi:hypothetical protein